MRAVSVIVAAAAVLLSPVAGSFSELHRTWVSSRFFSAAETVAAKCLAHIQPNAANKLEHALRQDG